MGSLYNEGMYFSGQIKSIDELDSVDLGNKPINEDEIVLEGYEFSYYFDVYKDELIGTRMTLQNNRNGTNFGSVKIAGLKYNNDEEFIYSDEDAVIYIQNSLLEKLKLGLGVSYSNIELTVNDRAYLKSDYNLYYEIKPSGSVSVGEAYAFNDLNRVCKDYNCLDKTINIKASNIYFEDSKDLVIKKMITKDNIKGTLGVQNWDLNSSTIFINESDYNNLFYKGDYQVSVFLSDLRDSESAIEEIKGLGYDTYFMKDNLVNEAAQLLGVLNIFRGVMFIVATVALFFISYFIIKIILKSRNVYFSTIRILGATKKVSKQLLNIELFVDINVAYLAFLGLIFLANSGVVTSAYIKDLITYFTLKDYILIYIVLVMMSLLISNRYAHKLFKDSVMSTYREEV